MRADGDARPTPAAAATTAHSARISLGGRQQPAPGSEASPASVARSGASRPSLPATDGLPDDGHVTEHACLTDLDDPLRHRPVCGGPCALRETVIRGTIEPSECTSEWTVSRPHNAAKCLVCQGAPVGGGRALTHGNKNRSP